MPLENLEVSEGGNIGLMHQTLKKGPRQQNFHNKILAGHLERDDESHINNCQWEGGHVPGVGTCLQTLGQQFSQH